MQEVCHLVKSLDNPHNYGVQVFPVKGTVNPASYKYIALNDSAFVRKASSINIWVEKLWRNSSGLHRALTSTLLNTFGMTWKGVTSQGFLSNINFSEMFFRLNGHKLPQIYSNILWNNFPEDWKPQKVGWLHINYYLGKMPNKLVQMCLDVQ